MATVEIHIFLPSSNAVKAIWRIMSFFNALKRYLELKSLIKMVKKDKIKVFVIFIFNQISNKN